MTNAEYGIKMLMEVPREYVFYLRGTLATLDCIPPYMLEEGNQKFGLGIRLDEDLKSWSFRDRASRAKNQKAIEFIDTYDMEYEILIKDPTVKAILGHEGERNIIMHRKPHFMQVSFIAMTPDERYEAVGKPTLHFMDKKGEPTKDEIPKTLSYCLSKLGEFRGCLAFGL